jgi:hypothetical protein
MFFNSKLILKSLEVKNKIEGHTVTVTVTDSLLQHELQKSLHPSPVVSRLLRRPVQSSPT